MTVKMKLGLQREVNRKSHEDAILILNRAHSAIMEMYNCGMMNYDESEEMKHFIGILQRNYGV